MHSRKRQRQQTSIEFFQQTCYFVRLFMFDYLARHVIANDSLNKKLSIGSLMIIDNLQILFESYIITIISCRHYIRNVISKVFFKIITNALDWFVLQQLMTEKWFVWLKNYLYENRNDRAKVQRKLYGEKIISRWTSKSENRDKKNFW